jgi:peptide deformylase
MSEAQLVLPIVSLGDPVLRRPAEPVGADDLRSAEVQRLIQRMRATMAEAPGVGLAAPQIGESIQLAVVEDGAHLWGPASPAQLAARQRSELPFFVLANPTVEPVDPEDRVGFFEGCLSVPGLIGMVSRWRSIRLRALDEAGEPYERTLVGWPARIVQHEVDHLGGVVYLDRVETRSLAMSENYLRYWAGPDPEAVASAGLGFVLPQA